MPVRLGTRLTNSATWSKKCTPEVAFPVGFLTIAGRFTPIDAGTPIAIVCNKRCARIFKANCNAFKTSFDSPCHRRAFMMSGFLTLLAPHLGLIGARRHSSGASVHTELRTLSAHAPARSADLASQCAPAAVFSEYEFADNQLAVFSSSIVLDYRAPK
jgi:hypothetical protein